MKQSNWTCSTAQSQLTFLCSAGSELTTVHTKCRVRQGPRAASPRQTTLTLLCRAQLAQSTSKSLSQNIVGRTNYVILQHARRSKRWLRYRQAGSCTHAHSHSPLSRGFGVAANGIYNAGRQGVFARGMGGARATQRRTKQSEHGQRNASPFTAFPVPGIPVPAKGTFSLSHTRVEAQTELSAKETCKLPTGYAT